MARNPYYAGPLSDHFDGTRFFVPGFPSDKAWGDLFRFMSDRSARAKWPESIANPPASPVLARVEGDALRVTSIGHASVLIQTQGLNLLVDPVFSERASPFSFAGPKRANAPGLRLADLPKLDAILITHNHYDHLDVATLAELARINPCRVLTPLGNDAIMNAHDKAIAAETYDWGARVALSDKVFVNFEPSYHWSARGVRDRRMALWAAFIFETPGGKIYHIGDTGYASGDIFRSVHAKYGPMRLAILPIGAYEPRWFMRDHHVNPEEAVKIFQECDASYALAHHWGTFQLTHEAIDAPPKLLRVALQEAGIEPQRFRVQKPGQAFDVPAA